jgi:hypothetical protein
MAIRAQTIRQMNTEIESRNTPFSIGDGVIPKFVQIDGRDENRKKCKLTKSTPLTVKGFKGRGDDMKVSFVEQPGCWFETGFFRKV